MDDNPPLCPDYWPKIIWDLHFLIPKGGGDPPNPVNYPVAMNDIMAGLTIHTASYLMTDQKSAQMIRTETEKHLSQIVLNLSKGHDAAMLKKRK